MSAQDEIVVVERRVNATPATVFSFFTDGERWMQWQGVEATIELRPGGLFRVNVSGDGFAVGRFLEVVHDRRLVFTWGWEMPDRPIPPGSSTVEIELLPDGTGTLLRLTHTGLPPAWVDVHRQGWDHYIDRLQSAADVRAEGSAAQIP